ncbi:hypothetical protein GCM10010094_89360 [Streptomyces flaveus]|uniref:Uncharacterized protein n=1 Tax=Streptomyces flaveus TaxID=66370 RepID=A0A917RMG6_9ACTN|nr:hypothetical protein GCM10010094_89360 [Streptomyces flaveus]
MPTLSLTVVPVQPRLVVADQYQPGKCAVAAATQHPPGAPHATRFAGKEAETTGFAVKRLDWMAADNSVCGGGLCNISRG